MTNSVLQQILNSGNKTVTTNGAAAHVSTFSFNLDFYGRAGNINYPNLISDFVNALQENQELALRNLLHMRDIRGDSGGYGVRNSFRILLKWLAENNPELVLNTQLIRKTIELGRWDDLFTLVEETNNKQVINFIVKLVSRELQQAAPDGLMCKWFPLKNSKTASLVRTYLKWTPKQLRSVVVRNRSSVVERIISENRWGDVVYSHVPSKAFKLYKNAFYRHDNQRFTEFNQAAIKGEVKVNASAVWPHEVVKGTYTEAMEAQWNNLPNFIPEGVSIIPMIDISASMNCSAYSSYTCMDISTILGTYIAERNTGAFKDLYITFSNNPKLGKIDSTKNIQQRIYDVTRFDMGLSTNIEAAMRLILDFAVQSECSQEDLPGYVLALTDCQFNTQVKTGSTSAESWNAMFAEKGYIAPKLIFWNLNSRNQNVPVTLREDGTAFVSGCSPAILKSVLSTDLESYTPLNVMLKVLNSERYSVY